MIKKILVSFMMLLCFTTITVKSCENTIPLISQIYKEGIYRFDNTKNMDVTIELLNDTNSKLILVDENNSITFASILPYKEKFTLKSIKPKVTFIIIGSGDVSLNFY